MALPKHYDPKEAEPRLAQAWRSAGVYHYQPGAVAPVFSIDTPPATVSGHLHLGHVYSYSHTDFIARFKRMSGHNVFYPMGFDDNGLPTERLVEKRQGITAAQVGRAAFIEKCLQVSEEAEQDYRALWQRLGLSIDWRYTYRTIDERSRRTSQLSFIDLYHKGLAYRRSAPAIWCPECHTALAQADVNDLERDSEYVHLRFESVAADLAGAEPAATATPNQADALTIATTRPELLPACVAVFIHPTDRRYQGLAGRKVRVPLFGQVVPILEDPNADPEKGSGAVMCCTFGDAADVAWWYTYRLPHIEAIDAAGKMTAAAGAYAGLPLGEARKRIKDDLAGQGFLTGRQPTRQVIRVHERCDTPVEYVVAPQWFIRILDAKQALLQAGEQVHWHPEHMHNRYQTWVENLNWDWCISRQRYFGVAFPLWYCQSCGEVMLAEADELPVDPTLQAPSRPCPRCGCYEFTPERDIFDTWATSSMSPQIAGQWLDSPELYQQVFPFSLRPQAHEIIRTWAFYTIVKSSFQFQTLPWKEVQISGWGLAGEGMGKISKSRGGGPMSPLEMIARYSSDAVRYWAASTGPGKDSVISEDKIQMGAKLVTKLWNVARFAERFIDAGGDRWEAPAPGALTPADGWILARLQNVIGRVTKHFLDYDYALAKSEIEAFFWRDLADNYLEMCKQRLYEEGHPQRPGAIYTLRRTLLDTLKLFAPFLPYVTEAIYQGLFADPLAEFASIHRAAWPQPDPALADPQAEATGERLVEIATALRRYKSEHNLPLSSELPRLQLAWALDTPQGTPPAWQAEIQAAAPDLMSITRCLRIDTAPTIDPGLELLASTSAYHLAIQAPA